MLYIREIIVIITIYTNQLTILLLVKWATRLDHLSGDSNNNNNNNNNNNKENGTSVIPLSKYRLNTQLIPLANCIYFLFFFFFLVFVLHFLVLSAAPLSFQFQSPTAPLEFHIYDSS